METEERRQAILETLTLGGGPVTGKQLADRFDVSRQVIVQDIAILRARGARIMATPQGYIPDIPGNALRTTLACRHTQRRIGEELCLIVDRGGAIIDVIVDHPLYGELNGSLMIRSRRDVEQFVRRLKRSGAQPLAALTGGVHLHTVEVPDPEALEEIKQGLKAANMLLEDQ